MVEIRKAGPADRAGWEALFLPHCRRFGAPHMDEPTLDGLWHRIHDPAHPMSAYLATMENAPSRPVGLAHTILHPHTFSLRMVCYLEDLWVDEAARGHGIGSALIDHLVALGRAEDWERVYWITTGDNEGSQRLYDRIAMRTDYILYQRDIPERAD
ncbi:GNAT family N-acetyltransferase [Acuticoccus sp. M5D2P5]|uniref:GNAT family N-acetyltransferase n=1 Tax=Acuticoccus kalidii TaxID=2910977 RepID=UPI001F199B99|nr:GNAT family N-acetyltransferase [Acuticoccus kalidii]MCF3935722.1 GNAT family N-acetyltransferase [Acuticoccus kalidii]